jgi:hypothetical protein
VVVPDASPPFVYVLVFALYESERRERHTVGGVPIQKPASYVALSVQASLILPRGRYGCKVRGARAVQRGHLSDIRNRVACRRKARTRNNTAVDAAVFVTVYDVVGLAMGTAEIAAVRER